MTARTEAQIELEPARTWYTPGERLRVKYAVEDITVQRVEISLGYSTEGQGNRDSGMVFVQERRDARGFVDIELPKSPVSYDGNLIKLRWRLRVRAEKDGVFRAPCAWEITIGRVDAVTAE